MVGHRPEQHRVIGALDPQAQLVAGDGVLAGGEHGGHRQLDVGLVGAVGEIHLEPLLARHVAHLDRELPVHGPRQLADDAPRLLPIVRHVQTKN